MKKAKILLVVGMLFLLNMAAYSMQIYISLPNGTVITLEVEATDTIMNVKEKIYSQTSYPPEAQMLYFNSELLDNNEETLGDNNIQKNSTLYLQVSQYIPIMPSWALILLGTLSAFIIIFYLHKSKIFKF